MFVTSYQRRKNLGSRVALLPGKFLRVQKVFVRMLEKRRTTSILSGLSGRPFICLD